MPITANEQYFLELVNRARLDPNAEAERFGIDLNQGLAAGTLTGEARQVLAPNALLGLAGEAHSLWMLATDIFSHTGVGGSTPGDRMGDAGYQFTGAWTWGENIAWSGTTGTVNPLAAIDGHHQGLFLSVGHRLNILNDSFREIGIAQEIGSFTFNGTSYNASMATQAFATSGSSVFLTGVVYADTNADAFYSVGEGRSGAVFRIGSANARSEDAGGYALATSAGRGVRVEITEGGTTSVVKVDLTTGNVKLDLVNGTQLLSSADLQLVSGLTSARLLGIADLALSGNLAANQLDGNAGANVIKGLGGNDHLEGKAGNDRMSGGTGEDTLAGGAGNDRLSGGAQADTFQFDHGADRIQDFSAAQGDTLQFDTALTGAGLTGAQILATYAEVIGRSVVFDFGDGDRLTLTGVTSLTGLAVQIDFA